MPRPDPKFTPGPWRALRNSSFWQIDADAFDGQIGDTCASSSSPEYGGSDELGRANAMLMAAAPDLYSALRGAISLLEMASINVEAFGGENDPDYVESKEAWDHDLASFRAALARADGAGQ